MTCTTTLSMSKPTSLAISFWAAIGIFSVDQTSARSALTSAMAALGCSGLCEAKAKVNSASTISWPGLRLELHRLGRRPQPFLDRLVRLSVLGPRPQSTSRALMASMHWPNVSPRTAMPLAICTTSVMPGIVLTASRFLIVDDLAVDRRRPADHGGLGVGDDKVLGELLAPGHDVQGVDPLGGLPDDGELGLGLELDRHGLRLERRRLGGQLPVRHAGAVRGMERARPWP